PVAEAVEVKTVPTFEKGDSKFTKIEIICKEARFEKLKRAMAKLGITGMTVTHVMGYGAQKGKPEYYRGVPVETNLLPKMQVEMVVSAIPVRDVIETAKKALYTGHIGDGKIFVYDVEIIPLQLKDFRGQTINRLSLLPKPSSTLNNNSQIMFAILLTV
ncbi:P-II family nitrogen regulator, partial [uncultured Ruminococcus sp.]|uniref:P-II family nitrogen regulator n=1 Tax=uncultured Ruminococcus sp. TaxID=165186 RepID=UPI00292EBCAB